MKDKLVHRKLVPADNLNYMTLYHINLANEVYMTRLSIVLATYNGEKFIGEQLSSLFKQSVLPDELIVVDDGSKDNTLDIVTRLTTDCGFDVKIIRNETNKGYRANFIDALSHSTGDLIAFCDQDDIWDINKIACLKAKFEASPECIFAHHDATIVDSNGASAGTLSDYRIRHAEYPLDMGSWLYFSLGFTQCFRRIILDFIPFYRSVRDHLNPAESLAHDQCLHYIAYDLFNATFLSNTLVSYRQHTENVFGLKNTPSLTWKHRLIRKLTFDLRSNSRLMQFTKDRSNALMAISRDDRFEEVVRSRALIKSIEYSRLYDVIYGRVQLYGEASILRRLAIWVAEFFSFLSDRREPKHMRMKTISRDLLLGVTLGNKLVKS